MAIQITPDLQENIRNFEELFSDCEDIKKRKIKVGEHLGQECYIAYIEVYAHRGLERFGGGQVLRKATDVARGGACWICQK